MGTARKRSSTKARTTRRSGARWTPRQLAAAQRQLLTLSAALRADIKRELRKHDAERYGTLASNVADSAELAVADLVADLDIAEIDRDVVELHDVHAALERLAAGTYGTCVACGAPIQRARLERLPHAARCVGCQRRLEDRVPDARRPKL
jgi:RNA polymerase-binding transcription factor DksA